MSKLKNNFNGRRVRAWCVEAGITYEQLADAIGETPGKVKSWVYNQRNIGFDKAVKIAEYFGKPLDDLRDEQTAA